MPELSEPTKKLIDRQSTIMEIPNEKVEEVLREIVQYIAQDANILEALTRDMPPDPRQPLALDPQKVVKKVVAQVRESKDILKCVPTTTSGQRYFLQQFVSWPDPYIGDTRGKIVILLLGRKGKKVSQNERTKPNRSPRARPATAQRRSATTERASD